MPHSHAHTYLPSWGGHRNVGRPPSTPTLSLEARTPGRVARVWYARSPPDPEPVTACITFNNTHPHLLILPPSRPCTPSLSIGVSAIQTIPPGGRGDDYAQSFLEPDDAEREVSAGGTAWGEVVLRAAEEVLAQPNMQVRGRCRRGPTTGSAPPSPHPTTTYPRDMGRGGEGGGHAAPPHPHGPRPRHPAPRPPPAPKQTVLSRRESCRTWSCTCFEPSPLGKRSTSAWTS